jgi:hypothetical protein
MARRPHSPAAAMQPALSRSANELKAHDTSRDRQARRQSERTRKRQWSPGSRGLTIELPHPQDST